MTSTNGDLKGFIDQNQSPTKGKRILFVNIEKKHALRHVAFLFHIPFLNELQSFIIL